MTPGRRLVRAARVVPVLTGIPGAVRSAGTHRPGAHGGGVDGDLPGPGRRTCESSPRRAWI